MPYPVVNNGALSIEVLLWIEAVDRGSHLPEALGLWTGDENQRFTIDSQQREYFGAGGVLDVPSIVSAAGFNVQSQSASLAILTPEVEQLIRGYDARQAPVEIHVARFDPETNVLLGIDRVFRGWLDKAPISSGQKSGSANLEVSLASNSRVLTRPSTLKKSDESQRQRGGDRFFKYADVSGSVPVYWNMDRSG